MRLLRTVLSLTVICLLLTAPALVAAHAELLSSSPEAGETLDEPPAEIALTFDSELDPDGSEFTVTGPDDAVVGSGEVDLDIADRNEMRGGVEISEPGSYSVSWTSVAEDGDEAAGEFTFDYRADAGGSPGEQPNTAVVSNGVDLPLVGAGLLMLAAGGALSPHGRERRGDRRRCPHGA